MSPTPEIRSLMARAEAKAAEARNRHRADTPDGPSEPDETPHYERPRFGVIEGDGLGDAASDGQHAGADIEHLVAADTGLFDADAYGGRTCATCGSSLDGARADAVTCSSSCRGRRWRRDDDGDLDAERARPPRSPRTDQHRPAPVTHPGTAEGRTPDPERSNPA